MTVAVRGTIAAGFARALVELAVKKGARREMLAARSGIALADLDDQDNRIPLVRYMALMRAGKALTGDAALALHFGEAYHMAELSIVGLIGQSSENFAEAFAQLNRYNKLVVDVEVESDGKRLVLEHEGGRTWLVDKRRNPNEFPELTESAFSRMVCSSRRFGNAKLVRAVHVTHKAPAHADEYARVFQVPVTFESDRNALLMESDVWMTQSAPLPSRYIFGVLSARADALLKSLESARTTRARVESLLMPILHTGEASMDVIAERMGVSRPTLFRRLKAEGTGFEKVLDELRHRLALDYLGGVSVNEAAYLVGFSEAAAFSRAFKRWTGMSPRAARAATAQSPGSSPPEPRD